MLRKIILDDKDFDVIILALEDRIRELGEICPGTTGTTRKVLTDLKKQIEIGGG